MNPSDTKNGATRPDHDNVLRELLRQGKRAWSLMADGRVPGAHKLIPAAAVAYLLSPIDLLPEMAIFGIGYIDDFAIMLLALRLFNRLAGEHVAALEQDDAAAIDADYRVAEPGESGSQASI